MWLSGKEPACQCRRHKRLRFLPQVGKIPGGGNGSPPQYSCLGNPTDRGSKESDTTKVPKRTLMHSSYVHTRHSLKVYNSVVQFSPLVPEHCPHFKKETLHP